MVCLRSMAWPARLQPIYVQHRTIQGILYYVVWIYGTTRGLRTEMNNNNNDNTKKEYIRKFIHVHLIHVRSTRIEHIIQAVNDQSNIPTNTERSALFNHIGMWYPSPNPKNSARVSVKIYLLDTTGTDRLYICILSSYCANVKSVESDCSATGGEIDVRTVFLLFFFSPFIICVCSSFYTRFFKGRASWSFPCIP